MSRYMAPTLLPKPSGRRPLQPTFDLAALRQAVALLDGEVAIEGWAAERITGDCTELGVLLVTTRRVIFADIEGGLSAFPILKIDPVGVPSSAEVAISAWYGRMDLIFDNQAAANAVANLLRQDPRRRARETAPGTPTVQLAESSPDRPLMMAHPSI